MTPLMLLLILMTVQFALYLHATHIAQAAASDALSATRVSGGSTTAGLAEGHRVLTQLGNGPLHGTSIDVHKGPSEASVTVTGTVITVIPFTTFTVHAEAAGPVEKVVPPTGSGAVGP